MNEDEATRLFARTAEDIPPVPRPPITHLIRGGQRIQRRQRLLRVGGIAAVAALVFGGVGLLPRADSGALPVVDTTPTNAPSEFDLDSIKGLTGKDVGDALGLTPWSPQGEEIQECDGAYAEYSDPPGDGNAMGFCLAGITDDPLEELVIAMQVTGHEQTVTLKALAAAMVELDNDKQQGEEHFELMRKVSELMKQVEAEGAVD